MATVEAPPNVSKLPLLIMGAVVAMAVLITVALIAFRDTKTYEAGTPEAALQEFVQATFDRDEEAVLGLLTTEARARCESDVDRRDFEADWYTDGLRVELAAMKATGDTAVAEVTLRQSSSDDPFNRTSWTYDERFTLVRVNGEWRIERAGWPYELSECTRGNR